MSNNKKHQCPSCGGGLIIDNDKQMYRCASCGSAYDFEYFREDRLPKTIWAFEQEIYVRQYDPSIMLSIPRDMRLNYAGSITVSKSTGSKRYKRRALILDVINSVRDNVRVKKFKNALRMTKTDYLIIPEDYTCHEYLKNAGCQVVSSGENVVIYRYFWEKNRKNEGRP